MLSIFKKLGTAVFIVALVAVGLVGLVGTGSVMAQPGAEDGAAADEEGEEDCNVDGGARGGLDCAKTPEQRETLFGSGGIITDVINVMLFIIGAICVVMIIYGGIRYATSGGSQGGITAGKNTIIYAVVGLVIALIAYALVNWVFTSVSGDGNEDEVDTESDSGLVINDING